MSILLSSSKRKKKKKKQNPTGIIAKPNGSEVVAGL